MDCVKADLAAFPPEIQLVCDNQIHVIFTVTRIMDLCEYKNYC